MVFFWCFCCLLLLFFLVTLHSYILASSEHLFSMRSVLFATQGRKRILLDLVLFLMCVCVKPNQTLSNHIRLSHCSPQIVFDIIQKYFIRSILFFQRFPCKLITSSYLTITQKLRPRQTCAGYAAQLISICTVTTAGERSSRF